VNFSTGDHTRAEFQITPMIDVVFLLLVFFVVTYSMAQIERELSVSLPRAENADQASSRIHKIVVNVGAEGEITVNRRPMELDALLDRLERLAQLDPGGVPAVIIRADRACAWRHIVAVMDICAQAEVRHVLFNTRAEEVADARGS